MVELLVDRPVLLLFVVLALGTALGRIRVKGVGLGPAGVLFAALALSGVDERLALPEVLGTFGLAVFAYAVGITAGPSFFAALRSGAGWVGLVAATLLGCGALTWGLGRLLGFGAGEIAGLYAGANTNTPGLAAALVRLDGAPEPTVAYSLSYVGGVVVMLLAAAWALRRDTGADDEQDDTPHITTTTVRVTRDNALEIGELTTTPHGRVLFSRFERDGLIRMTKSSTVLRPGDLALVVGPEPALRHMTKQLGEPSDERLEAERSDLDYRRIVLSERRFFGRRVSELQLWERYGARPTRVRRGDQDFLATGGLVLQAGDRIRVAAPRERMPEVAAYLGDSEHGTSDINPLGLALGMALGLLLGAVPFHVPGLGGVELGQAAGPLLVGLVLGRLGRTGPVVWTLPRQASETLNQVGILLFLAYAGGRAGSALIDALRSPLGLKLVLAGLLVTVVHAAALVVLGRRLLRPGGGRLAGIVAGSQTQPAVLAYAEETSRHDQRVALGYALVYPVAMVVKILVAQVLLML